VSEYLHKSLILLFIFIFHISVSKNIKQLITHLSSIVTKENVLLVGGNSCRTEFVRQLKQF